MTARLGAYDISEPFASGGMATIHFARRRGAEGFARTVAIKRLHPRFVRDPDYATMFLDEARLAAKLHHPNVVSALDAIFHEGELFLVMDWVPGETVARLAADAPIPPPLAARIFIDLLTGLHAAHETQAEGRPLGLVHRDVSPRNILVGADGHTRALDFGIAKANGNRHLTRDGALKGTVAYMAPEQLRSEPVTRLADVYAATVSLWEALTGTRLFTAQAESQLVLDVLAADVPPPSTRVPGIASALDAVVLQGLHRDRTRRFATARAMAQALERAVPPAPPSAVAAWVAERAHDALAERADRLADFETATAPAVASRASKLPTRLAIAAGAMMAVALVVLAARHGAAASVAPPAPSSSAPPGPPAVVRREADAPVASSSATPAAPRLRPPRRSGVSCEPPFTIEGTRKVFKPQCL